MTTLSCPYLSGLVELTGERAQHIAARHPELLPAHRERVKDTLADPDEVRRSDRLANARLFSRWFDALRGGKHVVVVVVSDRSPDERNWIITAYLARKLTGGTLEWKRS